MESIRGLRSAPPALQACNYHTLASGFRVGGAPCISSPLLQSSKSLEPLGSSFFWFFCVSLGEKTDEPFSRGRGHMPVAVAAGDELGKAGFKTGTGLGHTRKLFLVVRHVAVCIQWPSCSLHPWGAGSLGIVLTSLGLPILSSWGLSP